MVCSISKMAAPGSFQDVADGFQLVSSKKRRKRRENRHQKAAGYRGHVQEDGEDDNIDLNKLETKILAAKEELRCSEFFSTVQEIFRDVKSGDWGKLCVPGTQGSPNTSCQCDGLRRTPNSSQQYCSDCGTETDDRHEFDAIVCYGLGRFSCCVTARYQLGFLLLLKDVLDVPSSCCVYDPIFSSSEKLLLQKLGCQLILENEEGKRQVDSRTLFYMPHCGKPLYNNLLWANWGQHLCNVVILGNSLSNMALRCPSQELEKAAFYIHSILDHTKEFPLPNNFHFQDIFNDLSLHVFPVAAIPPSLWQQTTEPIYDLDWQEDIITNCDKS